MHLDQIQHTLDLQILEKNNKYSNLHSSRILNDFLRVKIYI